MDLLYIQRSSVRHPLDLRDRRGTEIQAKQAGPDENRCCCCGTDCWRRRSGITSHQFSSSSGAMRLIRRLSPPVILISVLLVVANAAFPHYSFLSKASVVIAGFLCHTAFILAYLFKKSCSVLVFIAINAVPRQLTVQISCFQRRSRASSGNWILCGCSSILLAAQTLPSDPVLYCARS
jgi:hypothetical protein